MNTYQRPDLLGGIALEDVRNRHSAHRCGKLLEENRESRKMISRGSEQMRTARTVTFKARRPEIFSRLRR